MGEGGAAVCAQLGQLTRRLGRIALSGGIGRCAATRRAAGHAKPLNPVKPLRSRGQPGAADNNEYCPRGDRVKRILPY